MLLGTVPFASMGKDMIIKILQDQLEAANGTILRLNLTVSNLNGAVNELNERIASLEALLKDRDTSLAKARNQMRGLSKLVEKKSERQKPALSTVSSLLFSST